MLIAYFLFALTPLFVKVLEHGGMGTFSIIFYRFLFSALFEFVIILVILKYLQKSLGEHSIQKKYREIFRETLRNYYFSPNPQFFNGKSQIGYLSFFGVMLVCFQIPFYFISFELVGVALSTILVNSTVFIIISLYGIMKKYEDFNLLKFIYMTLLLGAIIVIAYSKVPGEPYDITPFGLLSIIITIIATLFFTIGLTKDKAHSRNPLFNDFRIILLPEPSQPTQIARLLRAMLKIFTIHASGSLVFLPFCAFFSHFFPSTDFGQYSLRFIQQDLKLIAIFCKESALFLYIAIGTVLPYFLLFFACAVWPKIKYGQYDMWVSIFKMLQPLLGLYIGFYVWKEQIRVDYIWFTSLLILSTIFIRFFQETSQTRMAIFNIKINRPSKHREILDYLLTFKDVDEINFLTGTFDILVFTTVKSLQRLSILSNRFRSSPFFKRVEYTVVKPLKTPGLTSKKVYNFFKNEYESPN